jgi:hypothetical protein
MSPSRSTRESIVWGLSAGGGGTAIIGRIAVHPSTTPNYLHHAR